MPLSTDTGGFCRSRLGLAMGHCLSLSAFPTRSGGGSFEDGRLNEGAPVRARRQVSTSKTWHSGCLFSAF